MPFDGIVVKSIVEELSNLLIGGRIEKIFQPEADEIVLLLRAKGQNLKLLMSASASFPRIHFTEGTKENPSSPPVFCMLLRKHLAGGKITFVEFYDYERMISIHVESINELGDLTNKKLIIEIMGKHSNIILVNSEDKILDSIKHIDSEISSVREVMPARLYTLPPAQNKTSPEILSVDTLLESTNLQVNGSIENYLLQNIKGFSPLLCREICFRSGLDSKTPAASISPDLLEKLNTALNEIISNIKESKFNPCVIYENDCFDKPLDFHCFSMKQYKHVLYYDTASMALDAYYLSKDLSERLKQKKSDLVKVLNNSMDRCKKKISLQQEKLRDVSDREKLKLYGELITANIYCIANGSKSVSLQNYYSENYETIDIPLNENMAPSENAQKYFKQYSKAKSAHINTTKQLEESQKEFEYLESVLHLLENCITMQEIDEIRQELAEQGYLTLKKKKPQKGKSKLTQPQHYKSSDGLDIYVGKNNIQNDLLTLKLSSSNDMWLHTRNIPGSHVIIRKLQHSIPDSTLLEAATIAAFHSKAKMSSTVPVDYTQVKNVKKPNGAKPGMVIYENFKTLIVTPDEEFVNKLKV